MAESTVATANVAEQWSKKFIYEYFRKNQFTGDMGKSGTKPIHVVEELGKMDGEAITITLLGQLDGDGVSGTGVLSGSEEHADNFGHKVEVVDYANAVKIHKSEQRKSVVDLLEKFRPTLMNWAQNHMRDKIIDALGSAQVNGTQKYADCSEANKDTWVALQNPDTTNHRVLFGSAKSVYNGQTADHSDALGDVTSAMTFGTDAASLMRRMARTCTPKIPPIRVNGREEVYIIYAATEAFRDFKETSSYQTLLSDAAVRGRDNDLFRAGDLFWDGCIIKEIPEIPSLGAVGSSSAVLTTCYLVGAQAIGVAYGQKPTPIDEKVDYRRKRGVGVEFAYGVEKMHFEGTTQHGVVTGYMAGALD